MIEYAEITLYDENGDSIGFNLSPAQLKIVCQILGIRQGKTNETITCYSDKMLEQFFDLKGNPLNLKFKEE